MFDATLSFVEAFAVIFTVVMKDWEMAKVLWSICFLKKGMDGEATHTVLDGVIEDSPMLLDHLRPASCDCCGVNSKGLQLLVETQAQ